MGSMSNPNPWSPYDSYNDCSQGVCNIYCPQWCYLIFPPPPPSFLDDEDSSPSSFSPLLIALIGILATAFILVTYYTLISKHCHRRRENSSSSGGAIISSSVTDTWQRNNGGGLDETLIKSITVYKYRKGDGIVESSDCSVCLSEFEEDERLRLLPKCSHAFHVSCIDTWLRSHSSCPLCRAGIRVTAVETVAVSDRPIAAESAGIESVSIDLDLETGSRNETVVVADVNGGSTPKPSELRGTRGGGDQVDRNSGDVVLVADILREIEEDGESAGVGTSRRVEDGGGEKTPPPSDAAANQAAGGISNFLARSYGRARNYRLPS